MYDLENLGYKEAVIKMGMMMDKRVPLGLKDLDAFKASIILAVLYGRSKEACLDDLVKVRSSGGEAFEVIANALGLPAWG